MELKPVQPYYNQLTTAIKEHNIDDPVKVAKLASMLMDEELNNQKRIIRYNIIKMLLKQEAKLDLDQVHALIDELLA